MRTTSSRVTFSRPFKLPGFSEPHAPGTFEIRTDEERLDTVFEAWRRVATRMLLVEGSRTEAWTVERADLDRALAADRAVVAQP